eukprot:CAMPEP_0170083330 /NCGR_PEP_ID=MMETSP0019_2-20121128/18719_1 /TAXON_ID=98059 /ORGANISM="Dinobryon sp., Strain UTEXLB2267" /LENGTH=180 /DNA_ID=CAMNT_0010298695 /DNA_START=808 /DNA_END=1351 /DNA_ORIENTATION=+
MDNNGVYEEALVPAVEGLHGGVGEEGEGIVVLQDAVLLEAGEVYVVGPLQLLVVADGAPGDAVPPEGLVAGPHGTIPQHAAHVEVPGGRGEGDEAAAPLGLGVRHLAEVSPEGVPPGVAGVAGRRLPVQAPRDALPPQEVLHVQHVEAAVGLQQRHVEEVREAHLVVLLLVILVLVRLAE